MAEEADIFQSFHQELLPFILIVIQIITHLPDYFRIMVSEIFKILLIKSGSSCVILTFNCCCSWAIFYNSYFSKICSDFESVHIFFNIIFIININNSFSSCKEVKVVGFITLLYDFIFRKIKQSVQVSHKIINEVFIFSKQVILHNNRMENMLCYFKP